MRTRVRASQGAMLTKITDNWEMLKQHALVGPTQYNNNTNNNKRKPSIEYEERETTGDIIPALVNKSN